MGKQIVIVTQIWTKDGMKRKGKSKRGHFLLKKKLKILKMLGR